MDDKTCDLLKEVDEYFNNRGVNVVKFNKNISLKNKCPYEETSKEYKCTTNNDRVNALSAYLYEKISEINKTYKEKYGVSKHIEVFMIWLGDKLFKMDNDYKITLEESYKNNLENSMGNVNYWKAIDSQKIYKKATIKKMSDYYSLLNYICKLINEYNKNPQSPNRSRLGNYSTQCDNFYKTIHKSINGCKPYLQLLDSLKTIFEIFRIYKIVNNYNIKEPDKTLLLNRVKSLTTFQNENRYFVTVNAALSFDDKECLVVKSNDEQIGEKIASQKPKNPVRGTQARVPGNAQHGNTGTRKPASPHPKRPPTQPTTLKQPSGQLKLPPPSPAKPAPPKKGEPPKQLPSKPVPAKPQTAPSPHPKPKSEAKQQQASQLQTQPVQSTDTQQSDPPPVSSQKPGPLPAPPSASSKKDTKLNTPQTGEIHQNGQGGPGDGKGGTSGEKGGKSSGSVVVQGDQGGSSGGSGDGKKNINPGLGNHGGSGTQVGTDGGQISSNSGKGDPVNVPGGGQGSGASDGQGSQGITNSESGGAGGGPGASKSEQKASDSDKGNKDGGTNDGAGTPGSGANGGGHTKGDQGNPSVGSTDPASSTSGISFDFWSPFREFLLNGTEIYNKTFQFIKENQQRLNDAKDQISNAYDNAVNNLKSAYSVSSSYFSDIISNISSQFNQVGTPPKPGNSGNSTPQNNDQSQKNGGTSSPPTKDPPPKDQSQLPPQLPPSPTPQQPQPLNSIQQKQSSSQSQHITHKPPQISPPNLQKIGQLVKSLSSDLILKKPWNIFPTTWNGSGDCKPEIKFMNTTLVCCTSEQCSLTGIPVILVLIPIILLIAYKYLSFGSSKKSEKKSMKRVIKLVDGNRKTKIIISSYDNKKDLKPVINSVGRKKDSLLNIYKLIRADPMPFINLFFLLIFFVYKRKRDTIE
ncbi:PIR protein CIR protein [Plasmodium vinckei petteri]|uniref:PIR protein CIR protein n=1 Tax=Plasmodium vinckei petteri TaxID=138298 RepID=A0A6V7SFY1_PLAVN|nr:PIR protein CIR protein [Plasmodium vinckei petteri]